MKINVGTIDNNILYKQKNETFDMFSTAGVPLAETTLQIIKIINDTPGSYDTVDITPTDPTFIDFKEMTKYTVTMPNEDCFVCVIFNGNSILFRVGNPILTLVIYRPDLNVNQFLRLKQFNDDGDPLFDDKIIAVGYGLYCIEFTGRNNHTDFLTIIVTDNTDTEYHKIVVKINNAFNIADSLVLQTFYYDWE